MKPVKVFALRWLFHRLFHALALLVFAASCTFDARGPSSITFADLACDVEGVPDASLDFGVSDLSIPDELPAEISVDGPIADVSVDGPISDASVDGPISDASVDGPIADVSVDGPIADVSVDGPIADVSADLFAPNTIYATPASPGTSVDGDLAEWTDGWTIIAVPEDWVSSGGTADGPDDLSVKFSARWNARGLYLAFDVVDDIHDNPWNGDVSQIWRADSVQVAFDVALNGGSAYDSTDDFEYGWALTNTAAQVRYRWRLPVGAPAMTHTFAVKRKASSTFYEVKLPPSDLGLSLFTPGLRIGFSALVNEGDGSGREGYLEWTSGIGSFKDPAAFGELVLVP